VRRWVVGLAALALLLVASGCTVDGPMPEAVPLPDATSLDSPLDNCAALSAPPPQAPSNGSADTDPGDQGSLPSLSLPCFTGDETVNLDQLPGPAVVNLWASWCGPCREELPVLQEFADDTADRVHVVGVITRDTRAGAAAFAADVGVTFPGIYDREAQLRAALPGISLPVTLFIDADGLIRHQHSQPLDADELEQLAAEYLGVTR
jgi:cytochrome c biogenesis protein CcmG, thiol:disulfide interchange protein DsbE